MNSLNLSKQRGIENLITRNAISWKGIKNISIWMFLLYFSLIGAPIGGLFGQNTQENTDGNLHVNGLLYNIPYSGTYRDFQIPTSASGKYIYLEARGGDGGAITYSGGNNHSPGKGGEGSLVKAYFRIGSGSNEIPGGATLRFIVAEKGDGQVNDGQLYYHAGGGGGGTGILFLPPGKTPGSARPEDWKVLIVAGGGGGGFAKASTTHKDGLPGNDGEAGSGDVLCNKCWYEYYDVDVNKYQVGGFAQGGGGIGYQKAPDAGFTRACLDDQLIGDSSDRYGGLSGFKSNSAGISQPIGSLPLLSPDNGDTANRGGYGFGSGGSGTLSEMGGGGGYKGGQGGSVKVGAVRKAGGGGSYGNATYTVTGTLLKIKNGVTTSSQNGHAQYRFIDNFSFIPLTGGAIDVAINAYGDKWIVGTNNIIHKFSGDSWTTKLNANGTRIAVGPDGIPWYVNASGNIFKASDTNANSWVLKPGGARDIAIDNTGRVWIIGNTKVSGGYTIYYWNGSSWTQVNGGATRIGAGDVPWIVNESGNIYQAVDGNASNWKQISGWASDISVDQNGQAYVVGGSNRIYRRENNSWKDLEIVATAISAGQSVLVGCTSYISLADSPYQEVTVASLTKGGSNESIAKPSGTNNHLLQSGAYTLSWQQDGNLVLYGPNGALWGSGTTGKGSGIAFQAGDGNLVIYGSGGAIWASGTSDSNYSDHKGGAKLRLTPAGALTIVNSDGRVLWKVN